MKSYSKSPGGPPSPLSGPAAPKGVEREQSPAKTPEPAALNVPNTTRMPLPDAISPQVGARGASSAVQIRAEPWSKRGKRMARFRTERVKELKHREADALRGALPVINHHVERLRPRGAEVAKAEAFPESAEALTAALQSALQSARLNRLGVMVEDFRRSGFHHLLAEMLVRGKLTSSMAKSQRDRLKSSIDTRSLSGDSVKRGFLVFDGLAQRLALLKPDLEYDLDGAPRVFLETYAGSFHRG